MTYNFDELIDRENTNCLKYDLREKFFKTNDVLPMWVADSDFRVHPAITDALKKRVEHGVFGYTFKNNDYFDAVIHWNKIRHNWDLRPEWIQYSPGVVPSLNLAVQTLTKPGDKIIIQSPVYFPFYDAVKNHHREILLNPLIKKNGRYQMDLEALNDSIDARTKLLFLCSPHNPTGNVWKKHELEELCQICIDNDIIIISDEIHADIIYHPNKHLPTASLSPDISGRTITLMAPSKTFNIAGLSSSYIVSENSELLRKITKPLVDLHMTNGNLLALTATIAAYQHGAGWVDELNGYLSKTVQYTRQFIEAELPALQLFEPEGTFLLWIDFSNLGLKRAELNRLLIEEAKIAFSDGALFGPEGKGFQRMNIACPLSKVMCALEQLKKHLPK